MNESDTNGEHESVLYEVKNESKKFFDQKTGMLPGIAVVSSHFQAIFQLISLGFVSVKCYVQI